MFPTLVQHLLLLRNIYSTQWDHVHSAPCRPGCWAPLWVLCSPGAAQGTFLTSWHDCFQCSGLVFFPPHLLCLSTKKQTRWRSVIAVGHTLTPTALAFSLTQTHPLCDCFYNRNISSSAKSTHGISLQNVVFAETKVLFHFSSLISPAYHHLNTIHFPSYPQT